MGMKIKFLAGAWPATANMVLRLILATTSITTLAQDAGVVTGDRLYGICADCDFQPSLGSARSQ